jgi:transcriptional regulator GlxA family with amidase domain
MKLPPRSRYSASIASESAGLAPHQVRLQEARARLIANPKDVAAVGFAVGYDSPSQFSREYRRLFGVPPGKDGLRLQSPSEAVLEK